MQIVMSSFPNLKEISIDDLPYYNQIAVDNLLSVQDLRSLLLSHTSGACISSFWSKVMKQSFKTTN